ncbi:DUF305 domain-containing protein [Parvularcula sp. ZS-1/3]|uniref:DUF305 domain-containing protein n=1 Tax=Parvularcula mediterranea TaxID=2732508 RepID=A0A7Y3RLS8_9PROT|nr:DUF305 domain-containing protein [Parvularcula mediterranea]NNU16442.1 DUF305 domain-containing protein [Parvularcula mediterranea]
MTFRLPPSMSIRSAALLFAATGALGTAFAQDVPIVQPGAPGQDARELSADEAVKVASNKYSPDDVRFMQGMIPHHAQAVEMAELVPDRSNNEEIGDIAGRILKAQADEIAFMRQWLADRGEPMMAKKGHMHHGMSHEMMGMATPKEMRALKRAKGTDFDRMFLELMIEHHEGAIRMVRDLHDQPGSAYDPVLFDFSNDIVNDQRAEITRMNAILAGLSEDPRVGLNPGLADAGSAISNLTLVASLEKPRGFFDPENPAGLPPVIEPDEPEASEEEAEGEQSDEEAPVRTAEDNADAKTEWGERWPLLSFWNTDMAFSGDKMIAGNYHGFNVYELDGEGMPTLYSSVVCPGGQGDVSIVGDLLVMSVEQTRGRVDCGLEGIAEDVSEDRFRGLRIFDISDLKRPRQVGIVQTCRGSHTHSIVSADDERIVVYNSGTSSIRDGEELEGCVGGVPGDDRTALFRIDVIEIPVADPSKARIVSSPGVFADAETGRLAGLWQGGDHGDDTQSTRRTDQCHDITIFPEAKIAAGACSGNGIILDIADPLNPVRIDDVTDKGFAYWHSATFNNDGTKVLFTDEWGGGTQPRCRASDPKTWGANAIYDIVDGKLEFASYYKIDAPQADQENCVAHNGSVIPVPGRDIFAQAWYQGGLSVIDFTDSSEPQEIAFFDRGPIHEERMVVGGYWSTYWYNGKIYGTEIVRGLDVLSLEASEHMTENEIAAAAMADMGDTFNPQQQYTVSWPNHPVVAKAYLDQLERDGGMRRDAISSIRALLDQSESLLDAEGEDTTVADSLVKAAEGIKMTRRNAQANARLNALSDQLRGIAELI